MKVICECGRESAIHSPPRFMEITLFVCGHGHVPKTAELVCVCGERRTIGPGTFHKDLNQAWTTGMHDGEWIEKHISCGAS